MDEVLKLFEDYIPGKAFEYLKPGVIHYFPKEQEIDCENGMDAIHLVIEHILKNYEVDQAEIICFGNNLYGKEVTDLLGNYPKIKINLMLCSPTVEIIHEHDRNTLNEKIGIALNQINTNVLLTESPPTLRSCILYNREKPILCCMQFYVISMLEERLPSFKGRQTPCVILYRQKDGFPMEHYVRFCQSEYKRLAGEEAYAPVVNEETGEVERPKK